MPLWLSITIAVVCWLFALVRFKSPIQTSVAIRAAVGWAIFGILLLLVQWPQVLTYLSAVWAILTLVDLVLLSLGMGMYSAGIELTPKGRKAIAREQVPKALGVFVFKGLLFAAFAYFFGF